MTTITRLTLPDLDHSVPKAFRDGTHRTIAPATTVERVRRLMPVMGITRVANVTGLDCIGIPVVMVCRPNSRSLAVSQGKGSDMASARASGLMESVEAYHAERITLPLILGSQEELRYSLRLVEVEALPRGADSRFHPDLPLLWIEGHDLLQDEPVWLPYELAHLNHTLPFPTGSGCFAGSSNGLASGNHPLEAISHAICELVERDAIQLSFLGGEEGMRKRRIDLETIDDPACREILEKYERAGVAVGVWDATSDVGIATFDCSIIDRAESPLRRMVSASGSGAHPSRAVALMRAITEAAQSRLTVIAGSRDDCIRDQYDTLRSPDALRLRRAVIDGEAGTRDFHAVPTWDRETLDEDVAWELERLHAVGIERVVAIDLTMPAFGLAVVRVVIPGLEGSHKVPDLVFGRRARALLEVVA